MGSERGNPVNARMQNREHRLERFLRGMLGLALIMGVLWALSHGNATSVVAPLR